MVKACVFVKQTFLAKIMCGTSFDCSGFFNSKIKALTAPNCSSLKRKKQSSKTIVNRPVNNDQRKGT